MESFSQVLISTLPALIVAALAWYMLKSFFEKEAIARQMEWKSKTTKETLALKLQAYERLVLLCERCDFMPLMLRMQTAEMDADQMHAAMMIGITQEFDHNVTQQIYVSDTLWRLVSSARAETLEILSRARKSAGGQASREQYLDEIFHLIGQIGDSPFQRALTGIRMEANALTQG
jgi:hypothetical protein